jgi:hypothetical protein
VNADLQVGAVEETLTVTGQAPLVDTRNVVQTRVLSDDTRESLPNGRSILFMALSIPGISNTGGIRGTGQDVVGASDTRGGSLIHGSRASDYRTELDGVTLNNTATQSNPGEAQEYVYEVGAISAESSEGGVRANIIPKEGGNRFAGDAFFAFTNGDMQSDNLTQKLIDLGVPKPNKIIYSRDVSGSIGGPIRPDRLWFFFSYRYFGHNEEVVGMYQAIDRTSFVFDPRLGAAGNVDVNKPAYNLAGNFFNNTRVTWQATPKNKFSFYFSWQPRHTDGTFVTGTRSMEAGRSQSWYQNQVSQVTWKSPIRSRLLIEANGTDSYMTGIQGEAFKGQEAAGLISVNDTRTGYTYRASPTYDHPHYHTGVAKVAVSYVTGTHAAKFGVVSEWGSTYTEDSRAIGNMTYTFQNGSPTQITIINGPNSTFPRFHRMGYFAQDQWTVKRFTVNAGVRLDHNVESIGGNQISGPNAYAPFQRWPGVDNVPNWKDISPRLGVAYDLFGNGKTALKWTLSRYVVNDGTTFASSVNPILFNRTANRSWDDKKVCAGAISGDFVPQECELGTLSNTAFGTAATTTTVDDALREGWGVRQFNWETSASVQHQILEALSVNLAFTRRVFKNFTVTDNRSLQPSDYDEFCITAPTDDRLGNVSGSRICGLYDLNPAKRTVTPSNLRTAAKNYGDQKESYNGVDLILNYRLAGRMTVSGGLNSGTDGNNTSACFVVDSPGAMRFCDVKRPWRTNARFISSIELPWDVSAGVSFQSLPGPEILASYSVANAQITSGLVQFVNPARTSFGSGSVNVALLAPGTKFNERLYQVDLRLAKIFRYRSLRGRLSLDIGNLMNVSTVLVQNNTYGTSWLRPENTLPGRIIKPGFQIEF